jgi:hypothetical protein
MTDREDREQSEEARVVAPDGYCRQLEDYLCRKNDGHLIRIVGPTFEMVWGWARRGIPIQVAFKGVDRYFERHRQRGAGRRRPVRVEFCEADILDVFDEWRRAVGISRGIALEEANGDAPGPSAPPPRARMGLAAHIDRVMARLTQRRLEPGLTDAFAERLDATLHELDRLRGQAPHARGEARQRALARLRELDIELVTAARAGLEAARLRQLEDEARVELAPFAGRMPPDSYAEARVAALHRLIRLVERLPDIALRP